MFICLRILIFFLATSLFQIQPAQQAVAPHARTPQEEIARERQILSTWLSNIKHLHNAKQAEDLYRRAQHDANRFKYLPQAERDSFLDQMKKHIQSLSPVTKAGVKPLKPEQKIAAAARSEMPNKPKLFDPSDQIRVEAIYDAFYENQGNPNLNRISNSDIKFLKKGNFDPNQLTIDITDPCMKPGQTRDAFSLVQHLYNKRKISATTLGELLTHFVHQGLDLNEQARKRMEIWSMIAGHPETFLMLVSLGFNPATKQETIDDKTSLIHYLMSNYLMYPNALGALQVVLNYLSQHDLLEELIDYPDEKWGRTPLFYFSLSKEGNEMLDLLLKYRPNPFIKDRLGMNIFDELESKNRSAAGVEARALASTIRWKLQYYQRDYKKIVEDYRKMIMQAPHKAARGAQKEPVTPQRLQNLTPQERARAIIMPEPPALRGLIAEYLTGELTPEQKKEIQLELEQEELQRSQAEQGKCVVQ